VTDGYGNNRYVKRSERGLAGLDEVDEDEDGVAIKGTWSAENEYEHIVKLPVSNEVFRHDEGVKQARKSKLDLAQCFVVEVGVKMPSFTAGTFHRMVDMLPPKHITKHVGYWFLGVSHFRPKTTDKPATMLWYFVTKNMDETVMESLPAMTPPLILTTHTYPLSLIDTPEWIL
jgi:hypothetical protein